jgi:hypothetical protein
MSSRALSEQVILRFAYASQRDALLECKEHNGQCVDQGAFVVSRP